jgi:hypothetical protein
MIKKTSSMGVGDLVTLKNSVLHSASSSNKEYLGVIVARAHNAIKVEWFCKDPADHNFPKKNQFTLKLKVVSKL